MSDESDREFTEAQLRWACWYVRERTEARARGLGLPVVVDDIVEWARAGLGLTWSDDEQPETEED